MSEVTVIRDRKWCKDVGTCLAAYGASFAACLAAGLHARDNLKAHPLTTALAGDLAGTLSIFSFSFFFSNNSFYDAYWSLAPPVAATYWASYYRGTGDATRQLLVLGVNFAWSLRLTLNWLRGWGGLGHEDWRYEQLRRQSMEGGLGRTGYWLLTSLGGIHLFPTAIVYGCLLPVWGGLRGTRSVGPLDGIGLVVGAASVALQSTADEQLRAYRLEQPREGHYGPGVMDRGVWRWCRHPNYAGELGHWLSYCFFAVGADRENIWTVAGWMPLFLLFRFASIPLMEERQLAKRPRFAEYQREVPSLLPRLFSKYRKP